jgi:hypothetical protein
MQTKRLTDTEQSAKFGPLCRSWYVNKADEVDRLTEVLGVARWTLDALHVGWDGQAWTFPEQNHCGQIIGANRRFVNGEKVCVFGSRRGLTYIDYWSDTPGPVFIVEGGSDVAAGLTLGLCMVGRPSNVGGLEYLKRLLLRHTDRRIIVVAERDEKDRAALNGRHDPNCRCCGQCYPGKFGAIETSKRLSLMLNRIVAWSFLPDGAKDLRKWLNSRKSNPTDEQAMGRLARSLTRRTHGIHV